MTAARLGNAPRKSGGLKPEAREERDIRRLFTLAGGHVSTLSGNAREGGTRQTRGLPDLWVAFPTRAVAGWFEVKAPDAYREWVRYAAMEAPDLGWKVGGSAWGKWLHAREQYAFGLHCQTCRIPWGIGAFRQAQEWLITLGLAVEEHGLIRFTAKGTP